MSRIQLSILSLAVLSSAFGCTRVADKAPLPDAGVFLVPAMQDTKLPLKRNEDVIRIGDPLRHKSAAMSTASLFRMVDDLKSLGAVSNEEAYTRLGGALYRAFYANPDNYTKTTFLQGPIPNAIAGQADGPIRQTVEDLLIELRAGVSGMTALLAEGTRQFHWPRAVPDLTVVVGVMDRYADWLQKGIQTVTMSPRLKAVAEGLLKSRYATLRPTLVEMAGSLDRSENMAQALRAAQTGIRKLDVTLDAAAMEKFQRAGELAGALQTMDNAQEALTVLVLVWRMTDPAERGAFKKISPELYKFFDGKSDAELDCLSKPHCLNPVLGIAKAMIFKQLEEYGIQKLRSQVDKAGRDSVVTSVRNEALRMLPAIPVLIRKSVVSEAQKYIALLEKVKADVPGFVRSHVNAWASAKFNQPLKGLETGAISLTLQARDQIQVVPREAAQDVVTSGAEALGASLSLAQEFLPLEDELQLRSAVTEPIMKLLAIGGFRQGNGRSFPNLLLPINGKLNQVFDLTNLMKDPTTYAVPDQFRANGQFIMDRSNANRNVSAGAQAELLKGISRQVRFFRDWEQNVYDVSLGKVLIEDLLPEAPKGVVKTSFLPKDILFSIAIANAGALLQNLVLDLSPGFLVLEKGEILWGNRYKEIKGNKVSTVAGLVSILNGKRDETARTADIARFVLALDEFMGASEGMEKTGASALLQKTDGGKSTLLADLLDIRKKLQLLQMGLANYLVQVAMQPDGSLNAAFKVTDHIDRLEQNRRLEDQALAIRALLASAKRLDLPLLRWSALDVYYGMNRNFFSEKEQFYAAELNAEGKATRTASMAEIVQVLLAGEELSEFMPADARAQWASLSRPWLKALQDL